MPALIQSLPHIDSIVSMFVCLRPRCAVSAVLDTALPVIEAAFKDLSERDDVGIILINQHVRLLDAF